MATEETKGGGASAPPYPYRHPGPVIVCGNAWCLHDDLARVRKLERYSDAPVIAVNASAGQVQAIALFTQHPRKMAGWAKLQYDRFGPGFKTHAAGKAHMRSNLGVTRGALNDIDYWWEGVAAGGTSAWGARRLAVYMGASEVVLCGMPLSKGPYVTGKTGRHFKDDAVIEHYRAMILKDRDWHDGVTSMSGWTMETFGAPDGFA